MKLIFRFALCGAVGLALYMLGCAEVGDPGSGGTSGNCDTGCQGDCVPLASTVIWDEQHALVWYGDIDQRPAECPGNLATGYLYAEPVSVDMCPPCSCGDPACVLPAGMSGSSGTSDCTGPVYTSFLANPDGSCSNNNGMPIPVNASKSLALLPPTRSPCAPKMDVLKGGTPTWRKAALICSGEAHGECAGPDKRCVLKAPATPTGFMQCIKNNTIGDEVTPCPDDYPKQLLLYKKIDWKVACSDCACDPPVASDCTADVSVFSQGSCVAGSNFQGGTVALGAPPLCVAVPANYAVGGMMDQWITNNPGTCTPNPNGGQLTGKIEVDHSTAYEYCCRVPGT